MPTITIEHCGGPKDGWIRPVSELAHMIMYPVIRPGHLTFQHDSETVQARMQVFSIAYVYELMFAEGFPSISDNGDYRYRYVGTQ